MDDGVLRKIDDDFGGGDSRNQGIVNLPSTPRSKPPTAQFMSPGQFFSLKSGKLGHLGDRKVVGIDRPLWYTPKMDAAGGLLDPIEFTPTESNKLVDFRVNNRIAPNA